MLISCIKYISDQNSFISTWFFLINTKNKNKAAALVLCTYVLYICRYSIAEYK